MIRYWSLLLQSSRDWVLVTKISNPHSWFRLRYVIKHDGSRKRSQHSGQGPEQCGLSSSIFSKNYIDSWFFDEKADMMKYFNPVISRGEVLSLYFHISHKVSILLDIENLIHSVLIGNMESLAFSAVRALHREVMGTISKHDTKFWDAYQLIVVKIEFIPTIGAF